MNGQLKLIAKNDYNNVDVISTVNLTFAKRDIYIDPPSANILTGESISISYNIKSPENEHAVFYIMTSSFNNVNDIAKFPISMFDSEIKRQYSSDLFVLKDNNIVFNEITESKIFIGNASSTSKEFLWKVPNNLPFGIHELNLYAENSNKSAVNYAIPKLINMAFSNYFYTKKVKNELPNISILKHNENIQILYFLILSSIKQFFSKYKKDFLKKNEEFSVIYTSDISRLFYESSFSYYFIVDKIEYIKDNFLEDIVTYTKVNEIDYTLVDDINKLFKLATDNMLYHNSLDLRNLFRFVKNYDALSLYMGVMYSIRFGDFYEIPQPNVSDPYSTFYRNILNNFPSDNPDAYSIAKQTGNYIGINNSIIKQVVTPSNKNADIRGIFMFIYDILKLTMDKIEGDETWFNILNRYLIPLTKLSMTQGIGDSSDKTFVTLDEISFNYYAYRNTPNYEQNYQNLAVGGQELILDFNQFVFGSLFNKDIYNLTSDNTLSVSGKIYTLDDQIVSFDSVTILTFGDVFGGFKFNLTSNIVSSDRKIKVSYITLDKVSVSLNSLIKGMANVFIKLYGDSKDRNAFEWALLGYIAHTYGLEKRYEFLHEINKNYKFTSGGNQPNISASYGHNFIYIFIDILRKFNSIVFYKENDLIMDYRKLIYSTNISDIIYENMHLTFDIFSYTKLNIDIFIVNNSSKQEIMLIENKELKIGENKIMVYLKSELLEMNDKMPYWSLKLYSNNDKSIYIESNNFKIIK